jgi:hypothetical protein
MFGYDIKGYGKGFTAGAIGALAITTIEIIDFTAPKVQSVWSAVTSQRAIATYKAIGLAILYAAATAYALGVLTRKWYEGQKASAFLAYAAKPTANPVVKPAARLAARAWVSYWRWVHRTANAIVLRFWPLTPAQRKEVEEFLNADIQVIAA